MPRHDRPAEPIPAPLLAELAEFTAGRLGLGFPADRRDVLARGIALAATELGFADSAQCAVGLLRTPVARCQLEILARHLTIGETYFFREPAGLDALMQHVLELVRARRELGPSERRLRIWSAGCATGEEAYTIAMLLELAIPDLEHWDLAFLASDINSRALDHAREGVYRDWSFRGMDAALKARFFARRADGQLEIAPHIRRRVEFSCVNLAEDTYPSGLDVILCRNVLLYFTAAQSRKVVQRFSHALLDGGGLLIGAAEAAQSCFTGIDTLSPAQATLYRKSATASRPAEFRQHSVAHRKPERTKVPPRRTVTASRLRRHSGAADTAAESPQRAPAATRPEALVARMHADRGALAEALAWSGRAIAADKCDARAQYLHASILVEMQCRAEAVQALKRAIYLAPDFVLAHYALGLLAHAEGKRNGARKHLENVLAILAGCGSEAPIEGAEGLRAGDLAEMARALRESLMAEAAS